MKKPRILKEKKVREEYSDALKAELDRRYEEYLKDGITIPWAAVKEHIQKRIRQ
jgi:putative addiction module component (TIGR02574 family)